MSLASSNPPQPANPGTVAKNQYGFNVDAGTTSQAGSMVNQNNPYGSLTYTKQTDASGKPITGPGGVPLYTSNINLSPAQQELFNTLQGTQGTAGKAAQALFSNANYGATSPTQAIGDMSTGLEGQMMTNYMKSVQPGLTEQTNELDNRLRNQGLFPGEPGYDNPMRAMTTNQTNAMAGAAANYAPQAFSQASSLYQMPASLGGALAALGQPGSVNQNLVQTPGLNVQSPDYIGANANYNQTMSNNYAQQIAQQDAMMGAIGNIAGLGLGGWASGRLPNPFRSGGGSLV